MRQILLVLLSAFCFSATAQITVTAATFPKAGDTLKYAFDEAPVINAATPPGGNQTWDFSALKNQRTEQIIYHPTSAGTNLASFPGADMVVIGADGETYYNLTSTKLENMGFVGSQLDFFNVVATAKYSPVVVERRAPLNFFDIFQQQSNLNLPFSASVLPAAVLSFFPVKPDSIRVKVNLQRIEVVDGWGNCIIPGGNYPVLRMKSTEYSKTGAEIKLGFFWLDLSQLLPSGGGGPFGNLLNQDTTVTYRFLDKVNKEEIAVVTMNAALSAPTSVRFKNNKTTSVEDGFYDVPDAADIQASPNPATERVQFECKNIPSGHYTLKINNLFGQEIWRQSVHISGRQSVQVELGKFQRGAYFYSLADQKGRVIGTKKLVVVKP